MTGLGILSFLLMFYWGSGKADGDSLNCRLIDHFGGYAYALCVEDTLAFVGFSSFMEILSVKDPSNPVRVGHWKCLTGEVQDIYVEDDVAYIADHSKGLRILDISDIGNPKELGSIRGVFDGVWVVDTIAYVTDLSDLSYGKLCIINVADPASPCTVSCCYTYEDPRKVEVWNSVAYVADGNGGLKMIDVSDLNSPTLMGTYTCTLGLAWDLCVVDTLVYLAYDDGGLRIVNVADPTNPVEVGFMLFECAMGVDVVGNYAYVADNEYGLRVVDVSDPTVPVLVGEDSLGLYLCEVDVQGNVAYLVDGWNGGLKIVDVSDPTNPVSVGSYDGPHSSKNLWVVDTLVYVADGYRGLCIVDISDIHHPRDVIQCDFEINAYSVMVEDTLCYLTDTYSSTGFFKIVSVADPANPVELSSISFGTDVYGFYKKDTLVYLACGDSGLCVVNVVDPTNPVLVGAISTTECAYDVMVVDTFAYVADDWGGVRIINVADVDAMSEIGSYSTSTGTQSLWVVDTILYVADLYSGLEVVNVADPSTPVKIGSYPLGVYSYDVVVVDTLAFIANGLDGVRVISVADPTNPVEVAFYNTGQTAFGVFPVDTLVYVADIEDGMYIIGLGLEPEGVEMQRSYCRKIGEEERVIRISSNPLRGEFWVECDKPVYIYTPDGRLMGVVRDGTLKRDLPAGVYILRAEGYAPLKVVLIK